MSLFAAVYGALILCTVLCVALKSTHSGTVPQLLPIALPPCSWCHYSRTERSTSLRSLLRGRREEKTREKKNKTGMSWWRTAASFGNNRRENAVCLIDQSSIFVADDFKKNICEACELTSSRVCQLHVSLSVCVYACVEVAMFDDNVSFTTGPLGFHWSLWAGRILPAAFRKVTVWMTDGRAAKIKETQIL